MNARVGELIGDRYRVRRVLGEGAFGAVYEAEHLLTRRPVALKILHAHLTQAEQLQERFLREARAMALLKHPGLVNVLDAGVHQDTLFVAMELLEGQTLEARLSCAGRLPAAEALRITSELLAALSCAHDAGIIHRDLKPANIFLCHGDGPGSVRLLDFGVAQIAKDSLRGGVRLTNAGALLGTPAYMCPEQARGRELGPEADLWAAGVVLFEMLSGEVPWGGDSLPEVLLAIATQPAPELPSLPAELQAVLRKALEKSPESRFHTAGEMADALANLEVTAGRRSATTTSRQRAVTLEAPSPDTSSRRRASSVDLDLDVSEAVPKVSLAPPPALKAPSGPSLSFAPPPPRVSATRLLSVGAVALLCTIVAAATLRRLRSAAGPQAHAQAPAEPAELSAASGASEAPHAASRRLQLLPPFGSDERARRAFASHLVTEGGAPRGASRRIATCTPGRVFLFDGAHGEAVSSGDFAVQCREADLAFVPDQDGDGREDLLALSEAGHSVLLLRTSNPLAVLRTLSAPPMDALRGGLRVAGADAALGWVRPRSVSEGGQLFAFDLRDGALRWRAQPSERFPLWGNPSEQGLAVGPDASGDGAPDIALGAAVSAATPAERRPTLPRCVELLDGSSGARLWPEPFCQRAGGSQSVSLGADADGDGLADVAVSTDQPRRPDPHVLVLSGRSRRVLFQSRDTPAAEAGFGWPVVLARDLTGDRVPDLLVGTIGRARAGVSLLSGASGAVLERVSFEEGFTYPWLNLSASPGLGTSDGAEVLVGVPSAGGRSFLFREQTLAAATRASQ